MKRRRLIAASCGAMFMPATALMAGDAVRVDYSPQAYAAALASGEPLLLDFFAPW